ncbi:MAG: IPT/TIG domain-containing protein [Thermoanaerobaculia bacterium]
MIDHRRSLFAFAVLLIAFQLAADEPPEFPVGENGCAGARVLEHLERHGDFGQIDPEGLLYVSRVEHAARVEERRQGLSSEAIGGNVWTSLGPTNGAGRAIAIAFHPTTSTTAIMGAAGGGAWRTVNEGLSWTPITETIPNLSVGAISYAPSDANRVYLGTGEGGYAGDFIPGIGLLTSNDGGDTWTLPESVLATMFYRINVHPTNPNELIVATNKGALRSTHGANGPWTTVIASAPGVGPAYGDVTDIVRDPSNPAVLYAATWDRNRWCAKNPCNAAQNFLPPTILKSTDSGATWAFAATGFPVSNDQRRVERVSIAIAPTSPNTLYALTALFDATSGETRSHVYKTTDGGASWSETGLALSDDSRVFSILGTQGWYDNAITVSPTDPNVVIAGGTYYARTIDGGATWSFPFIGAAPHVDVHELRYHPVSHTLWIANDGGIWTSADDATTASNRNAGLVTRQYYAMSMDRVNRNRILGGTQDNGTNLRQDFGGTNWSNFSGGDGFQCFLNPDAPGVAFSTYQFAEVLRTKDAGNSVPLTSPSGPAFDAGEKKPFFSILKADPSSASTLYLASTRLWKSTTAGESWVPLSTNTVAPGTWNDDVIRSIAVAPSNGSTLMISKGSRVFRTTDGGATWNLLSLVNGLPGRTVTNLEISPANRDVVFATIAGTAGPSVYFTTDGGLTWIARASGLPSFSAQVIRFDPTDSSTLYVGTDVGVYRSTDLGATWSRFGTGMPAVSVYDLQIQSDGSMFRAATHGRGIWQLNVTGVTNDPPAVAITSPANAISVARGSVLTFTGTATDANNDPMSLKWTFPDDWSSKGGSSATHTFDRAGTWPVSLIATDSKGGAGGAEVTVTVAESSDNCATPVVVPAAGPFPWSVTLNSEVASTELRDPARDNGRSCYTFTLRRTMWLSFTPEVSGTYVFSLCASRVAGFVAAYTGSSCGPYTAQPMCVANTNLSGDCTKDPTSSMELVAGQPYRILVGSYYSNSFGPMTVTIHRGTEVAATLHSVSPASGAMAGGMPVILTGSGFVPGATVQFGGVPATSVTVINPNVISAMVPAHAAGSVDVSVQMAGTTTTSSGAFTYSAPPAPQGRRRAARK